MMITTAPKCPNHSCPLEGIPFPLPRKGEGICPVSGAHFDFVADVDEEKMAVDKYGNKTKEYTWTLTGEEK